jgi:hypothetical protein
MLEELRQVDISILDALIDLKRERDTLHQRLARLAEAGSHVQDVVLQRVRSDYEGRLAAIETKSSELKEKARASYAKLKPLREMAQKAFEATRLDEEELKLRHQLGEFSDEEYRRRVAQLGEGRKGHENHQAEISELVARFVGAFDSPEDLDPSLASGSLSTPFAAPGGARDDEEEDHTWVTPPEPPPAPAPPPPPPASAAAPEEKGDEAASGSVSGEHRPMPETAEAALLAAGDVAPPPPSPGSPQRPEAGARLHALDGDIEPAEIELETLTFVGRTPENQVRIYKPAVSRRHAQIASTDSGWLLRDLSSENGTYVNGQRVTERLLADGDRVQFGTSRFVFKSA